MLIKINSCLYINLSEIEMVELRSQDGIFIITICLKSGKERNIEYCETLETAKDKLLPIIESIREKS